MKNLSQEQIAGIIRSPALRQRLAMESIEYFFAIYFPDYISNGYEPAPFHKKFFRLIEDEKTPLVIVLAFRGSAKSTFFSTLYPIWAITGHLRKRFIVIITQTQQQAKKIMDNIKNPLENNGLLKSDTGPFVIEGSEWSSMSITLKKYDARIMVASTEQSIRGLRFNQHRPDTVILDDIEDLASVKTKESRDKLYNWYLGDVLGLKDLGTRFFLLGTRLDNDDLPSRLINEIDKNTRDGEYLIIPIVENGKITWPGKYPNMQAINEEERKVGNKVAWQREFMMNLVSSEEQLIKPEWITYYDKLPSFDDLTEIIIGTDLAIKQNESADFTSMIIVYVFGEGREAQYYVGSPIINRRLTLHAMSETAYQIYSSLPKDYPITFVVEDVGYQLAAIQELQQKGVPVEGIKPHGQDKYTRTSIITPLFENKRVHFLPEHKSLVDQLLGFPNERHDDMVDALVYALIQCQKSESEGEPELFIASILPDGEYRISSSNNNEFI